MLLRRNVVHGANGADVRLACQHQLVVENVSAGILEHHAARMDVDLFGILPLQIVAVPIRG